MWLVFHLFCVFIAPAAMPPASPLLEQGYRLALPYNQLLFLNHGYHYFAPDPGGSTLIGWSIPRDGDYPLTGRFPDPQIAPRLLYHRFFMLSDNLWGFDDDVQEELFSAYARDTGRRMNAAKLELFRITHDPSSMLRIQAGGHLGDPEVFRRESLGVFDTHTESQP
jgi:hypothetical protein